MVAGPHAFFELADTLRGSDRYYLTVAGMDHNDYISQGVSRREYLVRDPGGDEKLPPEVPVADRVALGTAAAGYRAVCGFVRRFLEAELNRDPAALEFLSLQYRKTPLGGSDPHVEHMPRGRTGPDPYEDGDPAPPSPRQVRPFLRERGSRAAIAALRRLRGEAAGHPIFVRDFGRALVGDLLDRGQTEDAVAFHKFYLESGLDCAKDMLELAKEFHRLGLIPWAVPLYKKVLALDPANGEAAAKLKEITEGTSGQEKR